MSWATHGSWCSGFSDQTVQNHVQICLPQISYLGTPMNKTVYLPKKLCTFQILFAYMGNNYYWLQQSNAHTFWKYRKWSQVHVLLLIHLDWSHNLKLCKNQYILSIYWTTLFTYCIGFIQVLRHNSRTMFFISFRESHKSRLHLEQLKLKRTGRKNRIRLTTLWRALLSFLCVF